MTPVSRRRFGRKVPAHPRIVIIDLSETLTNRTANGVFKLFADVLARPPAGVLLRITSNGGALGVGQAIVESIDAAAHEADIPVFCVVEQAAISAAFLVAMAGTRVFATGAATLGGLGAVAHSYNIGPLLGKLGVEPLVSQSGSGKTGFDTIVSEAPTDRAMAAALVAETLDQFAAQVAARRGLDRTALASLTDGRLISGREAQALGLVDELGATHAALRAMLTALDAGAPSIEYLSLAQPPGVVDAVISQLPLGFLWKRLAGRPS